jgi:hypothetical protein
MVARVTLHNMRQDRDEPIRAFGAPLAGQAGVCKFIVKCPAEDCGRDVNYTDAILRDALNCGIADPDIQLDLLSDKNQDMTLEDVLQFVEAKEAGKRSASRLLDSHATEAATGAQAVEVAASSSAYKKGKQRPPELCTYCGKAGHGTHSVARVRKTECPAYAHRCTHCNRDHHFEAVCRSKNRPKRTPAAKTDDSQGAVFDTLCTVITTCTIDHHLFDNLSKTWVRKNSQPQPVVEITIKASHEDYQALGFTLKHPSKTIRQSAIADTGCQSCLAGVQLINRLGLKKSDLIPVTMTMRAANNDNIHILGTTMLQLSAKDSNGTLFVSRQMTYITDCCSADKFFLSRGGACADLSIIPTTFPTVGGTDHCDVRHCDPLNPSTPCDCPRRQCPPPPPQLPFPATELFCFAITDP